MKMRVERVAVLILHELSLALQKQVDDPRLLGVTFTAVKVTADLQAAKVYFSMIADQDKIKEARLALEKAGGLFKRAIAENLHLRYTPELTFFYDETLDKAQRIEDLIQQIHKKYINNTEENDE